MDKLTKALPFSESEIDRKNYTASLLGLSARHNLINEKKLAEIKDNLDIAFRETAEQFTRRSSGSLPVRQAERLYSSVLFRSDVYLMSLKSPSQAAYELERDDMNEILSKGQALIMRYFDETKVIFRRAYEKRLDLPVYEYRFVMSKAYDEFRSRYSARFDARSVCTSIDYPLLSRNAYELDSEGVMYIREYYTSIMLENEFCSRFDTKDIHRTLQCYAMNYGCTYDKLLFNISSVLFANVLAGALIGKPPFALEFTRSDCRRLEAVFSESTEQAFEAAVREAFMPYRALISSGEYMYFSSHLSKLSRELFERVSKGTADRYLAVVRTEE